MEYMVEMPLYWYAIAALTVAVAFYRWRFLSARDELVSAKYKLGKIESSRQSRQEKFGKEAAFKFFEENPLTVRTVMFPDEEIVFKELVMMIKGTGLSIHPQIPFGAFLFDGFKASNRPYEYEEMYLRHINGKRPDFVICKNLKPIKIIEVVGEKHNADNDSLKEHILRNSRPSMRIDYIDLRGLKTANDKMRTVRKRLDEILA